MEEFPARVNYLLIMCQTLPTSTSELETNGDLNKTAHTHIHIKVIVLIGKPLTVNDKFTPFAPQYRHILVK